MESSIYTKRSAVSEWLRRLKANDEGIRQLESRIAEIRNRLLGMGYDPSAESRGGSSDALPDGVATLIDLEEQWNERITRYQRNFEHVRDICSLPNVATYSVWLRYVDKMTWPQVASKTKYSKRQAVRNVDIGVCELYPLVPEEIKRSAVHNAAPW